ncbi:cobalamin B12-binding domain-containing protein [Bacillus salacetis]|uniref:cobalamin B12-binding domain-containing protein n=1 Tax=Bacillus salacetis TaxID=2315464 RepID=UPI00109BB681|nr:cobalamin-dependent protein [Bacillus salacetis]
MQKQVRKLTELAVNGDLPEIHKWYQENRELTIKTIDFYEKILKPVMERVGSLWEKNLITVAEEHLATASIDYLMTQLRYQLLHPELLKSSPSILLFCLEGEQHSLGLKMVSDVFREYKWNVKFLGSSVPTEEVIKTIDKWEPDAIGISVSLSPLLPKLKECISLIDALERDIDVFVGGRVVSLYNLEELGIDNIHLCNDLNDIEAIASKNARKSEPVLPKGER